MKLLVYLSFFLLIGCSTTYPPRKIKLPPALNEVSGLVVRPEKKDFILHNDSGDDPILYGVSVAREPVVERISLAANAADWEDICQDPEGRIYVGDFGNNFGRRKRQVIYRYDPREAGVDSVVFVYPGQKGEGRNERNDFDCEAMVWHGDSLHLFTKAIPGRKRQYWSYHFQLATQGGVQTATLVDSIYLPRRTVTGASIDRETGEMVLVAYNFKRWLGFLPVVASSVMTFRNYPGSRFFAGQQKRRNLSWGKPIQYESVAVFNDQYWYVGTEKTPFQKRAFLRRKRRF